MAGSPSELAVVVLTRNSPPNLLLSAVNICALTAPPVVSPSVLLASSHATTKPPVGNAITAGCVWPDDVVVLTGNSPNHLIAPAIKLSVSTALFVYGSQKGQRAHLQSWCGTRPSAVVRSEEHTS